MLNWVCHAYTGYQLSLSRWIRLLFGREFYLPNVLQLWDALFVDGTSLALIDYLFTAMLIQIREPCELYTINNC